MQVQNFFIFYLFPYCKHFVCEYMCAYTHAHSAFMNTCTFVCLSMCMYVYVHMYVYLVGWLNFVIIDFYFPAICF